MRLDLTAAARIRDAAIDVFGRRGFDAASVREIAQEAGVSPALVIHHYGSKDKLREHCDDYLMSEGLRIKTDVDLDDQSQLSDMIRSFPPDHPWLVYVSRIILDGGPAGVVLWDRFVSEAARAMERPAAQIRMKDGVDPAAANAVATAVGLIPLVFQSHLARSLGAERLDGDAYQRLMTTLIELLMSGLYEANPKGEAP
ncbi:TetR/AcrR family transcriptional regulator [Tessaracoccus caeni]|uniref:TetR/AcrR family transcriptional regulator n=1 Tax=Tessaracoccus caeni TaxID=3031239 RepID=UPI0023DBCD0F|nr:TetR/AcrR family transcriptional regulator [Tessaracoccus caeni]MDF1486880.1 TetR family transcriptional regulator [Tessaracoccus caeni]